MGKKDIEFGQYSVNHAVNILLFNVTHFNVIVLNYKAFFVWPFFGSYSENSILLILSISILAAKIGIFTETKVILCSLGLNLNSWSPKNHR